MPSFNLVDEPWIPCLLVGGEARELSLVNTLLRSTEIREVFDPSPLVTVALHRLLLAVLHRSFGPDNLAAWAELWRHGEWDRAALETYLGQWRERFDLFGAEWPFYQTPELPGAK